MTDEEMAEEWVKQEYPTLQITAVAQRYIKAFLAGLKAGRPEWHKVADGDLPKHEVNVLVLFNKQCIDIAHYNYDYKEWHFVDSIVRDVIAWCEIPQFKEKESMFRKEAEDCEEQPKYCHDCAKFDEMPKGPRCKTCDDGSHFQKKEEKA